MRGREITLWLDERWYDALSKQLKGETLEQKVQCVKSVGWGMNTNLQAAFEHVLETARDHDVPPEEMPKALIVVSDMEIDALSLIHI